VSEGDLYVTYAKQDADKKDDVAGKGNGFVDVFDTDGNFIQRVASHGHLNSPWGLVFASEDFGRFSHDLLVGNFGDGPASMPIVRKGITSTSTANSKALTVSRSRLRVSGR
jgi:uncharacterized protein (TIGR03118 family)